MESTTDSTTSLKSDQETTPAPITSSPPDGGLHAWLQVIGCFFLYLNTWGILNTFGVFQTHYTIHPSIVSNADPSTIAWVGSAQACLITATSAVAGIVYDQGHLRLLLLLGSTLVVLGHVCLSFCNAYWQVMLAQGLTVGIGGGLLFVPASATLPMFFTKKLGTVVGLAASGASFGGLVYPIALQQLLDVVGFAWATRVLGLISMATLIVPITVLRYRIKPAKVRKLFDYSLLEDIWYLAFVLVSLISFASFFTTCIWIGLYATRFTSEQMSFNVLAIFNGASCIGRVLPNILADRIGPFNVIILGTLVAGSLSFAMIAVKSLAGVIILSVLLGFISGIFVGIPPMCFVALTADMSTLGTRIGMGYAIIGTSVLASGPGIGAVLQTQQAQEWMVIWVFAGITSLAGALGYVAIRVGRYGVSHSVKA